MKIDVERVEIPAVVTTKYTLHLDEDELLLVTALVGKVLPDSVENGGLSKMICHHMYDQLTDAIGGLNNLNPITKKYRNLQNAVRG